MNAPIPFAPRISSLSQALADLEEGKRGNDLREVREAGSDLVQLAGLIEALADRVADKARLNLDCVMKQRPTHSATWLRDVLTEDVMDWLNLEPEAARVLSAAVKATGRDRLENMLVGSVKQEGGNA